MAVKQLDRNGLHGNKEFLAKIANLSLLQHPNLVKLVGYCADGDQRLLVYEFITGGTLEQHLFDAGDRKPPDWQTRMKIASGAASGLEYLHDTANPPVIYRDFKSSNVLLDEDFNPKLTDFGLAKLGSNGDPKFAVPSRVMGTYGYSAPEYVRSGELTLKSDVYNFGVVLLELITGRRAIDTTKPNSEQNLVTWAQPLFKDPKNYPDLADPLLNGKFPEKGLNQAVAIAAMCLQEEASVRPLIADIAPALGFLATASPEVILTAPVPLPSLLSREEMSSKREANNEEEEGSEYTDEDGSEYTYTDEEGSEEYDDEEGFQDDSETRNWASASVSKGRTGSTARGEGLSSRKSSRRSRKASKKHSRLRSHREISDGENDISRSQKVSNGASATSCRRSSRKLQDGEVSMDHHGIWKPEDRRNSSSHKHLLEGSLCSRKSSRNRGSENGNANSRQNSSGKHSKPMSGSSSRKLSNKLSHKSSSGTQGHEYASISHRSSIGSHHRSERSSSDSELTVQ
ncbi:unnamed protein product [Rhodiola kirilowii]